MKRAAFFPILFGFLVFFGGCKKPASDTDTIRAGIEAHLATIKTINMSAMDMTIQSVSIQGSQANVRVEFLPKSGQPGGGSMQVAYVLEKQNNKWVVQSSQPLGNMSQQPAPDENSQQNLTPPSSSGLPNFRDLVGEPSGNSLPAEQPPANSQGNSSYQTPPPAAQ